MKNLPLVLSWLGRGGWLALSLTAAASDDFAEPVVQLDRLVVSTGTLTERLLEESPVRTEVLLSEAMHRRAPVDFSRAVELLNGVRIESNCQSCNTTEVQLLGLGGAYNQILFDGQPLLSVLGSVYGLEQIPAAFVDRIEVVKGGGSSLYGAGAVAGVINLVPRRPSAAGGMARAGVEVQRGQPLWQGETRVDGVTQDGRAAWSLVGQGIRGEPVDFNGDGYSEIVRRRSEVLGAQTWWTPRPGTTVSANYQFTGESRRGGNRFDHAPYLANVAEALDTRFHRGGVTWRQDLGADWQGQATYAFSRITRDSYYGGLGDVVTDPNDPAYDPAELDPAHLGSAAEEAYQLYGYTRNPLDYAEVRLRRTGLRHTQTGGVQVKRERVFDRNEDGAGRALATLADESFTNVGLYVQDEWMVGDGWEVVSGVRVDDTSVLRGVIWSPRLAVAWRPGGGWTWRASVSTGFRAPEVFSEDLHVETLGAEPVRVRSAPDLREERALTGQVSAGWRQPTDGLWAADVTLSGTRLHDTLVLGPVFADANGDLAQVRENGAGSQLWGGELNVGWYPSTRFRLTAGVAYQRSRYDEAQAVFDDTPEGGTTVIAVRDYLKTPRWSGVAQAVWQGTGAWEAFAALKVTGAMDMLNLTTGTLNRTPSFWVADVGVTRHFDWRGRHIDWQVGVRNLFDQRQRDLEVGVERDSDYVYGPRFARSFYTTVTWEF
jgi:outer membrane receptor for ferrienterochelin and colicins